MNPRTHGMHPLAAQSARGTHSLRNSVRAKLLRVALITTVIALCVAGAAMLAVDLKRYKATYAADLSTEAAMLSQQEGKPKLKLFPQRVKSEATVYAVFSIE